jgi:alpha-L-fucosidase
VTIKSLADDSGLFQRSIAKVELLGHPESLRWTRDANGLTVEMPPQQPCDHAFAFRISPAERE